MRKLVTCVVLFLGCTWTFAAQAAKRMPARTGSAPRATMQSKRPSLVFSFVAVSGRAYSALGAPPSIVVYTATCRQAVTVPLQLIVKNVGPDFTPNLRIPHGVYVKILPTSFHHSFDLIKLRHGRTQSITFKAYLLRGRYRLWANVEINPVNQALIWPFEVKCDPRLKAPARVRFPPVGGAGIRRH